MISRLKQLRKNICSTCIYGFVCHLHMTHKDDVNSRTRTITRTRSSATAEIARDANEAVIQGHSRSSVVVPIDAAYMTSY